MNVCVGKNTVELPQSPLAVYPTCNHGGYEILAIRERCGEEFVQVADNNGEKRTNLGFRKIKYTTAGRAYFFMFGFRFYLDLFIKIS